MKYVAFGLLLVLGACNKEADENPCLKPAWVENRIASYGSHSSRTLVERYRYRNQYVFLFSECYQCPDAATFGITCDRDTICLFGGFAGTNTCPDFEDKATHHTLIWKNF